MKVTCYEIQTASGPRRIWATSLEAASEAIARHTPGPWKCIMKGSRVFIDSKAKLSIACLDRTQKISPEADANARLIAAAPELLAALENIVGLWADSEQNNGLAQIMARDAQTAIARAKATA